MSASTVSVEWHGDDAKAAMREFAAEGLNLATEHLLGASRVLVPYAEGDLSRSGTASVDEDELVAAVSYNMVYAARQHEELTWRHKDNRSAKYLEIPFRSQADVMLQLLAGPMRRGLNGP